MSFGHEKHIEKDNAYTLNANKLSCFAEYERLAKEKNILFYISEN